MSTLDASDFDALPFVNYHNRCDDLRIFRIRLPGLCAVACQCAAFFCSKVGEQRSTHHLSPASREAVFAAQARCGRRAGRIEIRNRQRAYRCSSEGNPCCEWAGASLTLSSNLKRQKGRPTFRYRRSKLPVSIGSVVTCNPCTPRRTRCAAGANSDRH